MKRFWIVALVSFLFLACEEGMENDEVNLGDTDSNTIDTDQNQGTDSEADNDADTASDTGNSDPGGQAAVLDSSHAGWENAGCWQNGCHAKDSTHTKLKPHTCVECHGNNGAQTRSHPRRCVGCHETVRNHAPKADFGNSAHCSQCHG